MQRKFYYNCYYYTTLLPLLLLLLLLLLLYLIAGNGKTLCRVVIGVIYDKIKEHERLMNSRAATPGEGSRNMRHFSLTGRPKPLTAVELHTIKSDYIDPI